MSDYVKTYIKGRKVWRFQWPNEMSDTEKQDRLTILNDILRDIEENPNDYKLNLVEMAAVNSDLSKMQEKVCLIEYNAFHGYVKDVIELFSKEFNLKVKETKNRLKSNKETLTKEILN